MHAQQSSAQPAAASMSEEERAALDSERTFAQAAAAAIDHEGRRGGGNLCDAANAVDRLQNAIVDAHEPDRVQVQQLGMAFNAMPSELQRLDTAPVASFSAVSSLQSPLSPLLSWARADGGVSGSSSDEDDFGPAIDPSDPPQCLEVAPPTFLRV